MKWGRCILGWVGLLCLTAGVALLSRPGGAIVFGAILFAEARWGSR